MFVKARNFLDWFVNAKKSLKTEIITELKMYRNWKLGKTKNVYESKSVFYVECLLLNQKISCDILVHWRILEDG